MKTAATDNAQAIQAALIAFGKEYPNATAEEVIKFHMSLFASSSLFASGVDYVASYKTTEEKMRKMCAKYEVDFANVAISLSEGNGGFWLRIDGDKFVVVFKGVPSGASIEDAVSRIHKTLKVPALVKSEPKRVIEFSQETGNKFKRVKLAVSEEEYFELLPTNSFNVKCEMVYTVSHKKTGETAVITRTKVIGKEDSHILFAAAHQLSQTVHANDGNE
jgi:hypothetical protein